MITVAQAAQSIGAANNSTVALPAAVAGNTLASFMSQTGLNTPTCAGYAVHATHAVYNGSLSSVWLATKVAVGGETGPVWTAGAGGTAHGVAAWELAGASTSFDGVPVNTDNIASGTQATVTVQTLTPGSIILLGVGADTSSGAILAWTGANVATNIGAAAARCFGGSFITVGTVNSLFAGNWTTAHVTGMLAFALKPPGSVSSVPRIVTYS